MEKAGSIYSEKNWGRECFQVNEGFNAYFYLPSQALLKQMNKNLEM